MRLYPFLESYWQLMVSGGAGGRVIFFSGIATNKSPMFQNISCLSILLQATRLTFINIIKKTDITIERYLWEEAIQ